MSGVHLNATVCGRSVFTTANIFCPTLKTRSVPHLMSSVTAGKPLQIRRTKSICTFVERPSQGRGQCYITHMAVKTDKTDAEWQAELTPVQYQVLRQHGTEPRGSSPMNNEKREGTFKCAACGEPLFTSDTKYESGSGWPSFYAPLDDDAVGTTTDQSHGMTRTEVHCAKCGGHLGHVFPDGPQPTGLRYCMNGVSLAFDPGKDEA